VSWAALSCRRAQRLGRIPSASPDIDVLIHLQRCLACQTEWASLGRLSAAVRSELPAAAARGQRPDARRARLLASVVAAEALVPTFRHPPGRDWLRPAIAAAASAAAAAALIIAARGPIGRTLFGTAPVGVQASVVSTSPGEAAIQSQTYRGLVTPSPGARFSRSAQPDEVVRLTEGEISIDVTPLHPGERFRVVTADGEVEVHGTSFAVSASGDRLVAVKVDHGLVEVRHAGHPAVLLSAGREWHAPALAEQEQVAQRTPAEIAFASGWRTLRARKYGPAASSFERAAQASENASSAAGALLAEDARYWQAVALARAGRNDEARATMALFLDRYPTSARAGEVSVMLGWLLLEAQDRQHAAVRFRAAVRDHVAEVRRSARTGLTMLKRGSEDDDTSFE
jgi:hypothetical protein